MTADSVDGNQRHLLVTGASTGIGAACALHMATCGWRVFAGVRRKEDGDALAAETTRIIPITLDVTCAEHIAAAVAQVRDHVGDAGLHGVFNNAGIAVGGPLEHLPAERIMQQFEVNVFGAVSVTQAFLPLLRQARGRVVFTSSNSGFWCEPFLSVYGASKHALEAIGDALRIELRPWGMHVVLIEPGMVKTPIWEKARTEIAAVDTLLSEEAMLQYAAPIEALRRMVHKTPAIAAPPERVARALRHALEARRPKTRYRVGVDCRIQYQLRRLLPDRVRDYLMRLAMGL